MAANIEQIFQDFILNKIKEIEDQNADKTAPQIVATCNEMTPEDNQDKNSDEKSSQKKHKKHKKHKSKKKKRKRDKEGKENSSGSVEELNAPSRKAAPTDNTQPSDHASSSRSHKHKTGKKKKKKRKHKDEKQGDASDYDTKQKKTKCAQSLLPRPCDELPDIIPKQDSSSGAKSAEGKRRRSRSHSYRSHSSSERCSHPGKRKSRSRSRSSSPYHHTSSRSLANKDCLDPSSESKQGAAQGIQLPSPSPKRTDIIKLQSLDHNHEPTTETTTKTTKDSSAVGCAAPPSASTSSTQSHQTGEPVNLHLKASEPMSASARKSPAEKRWKSSKSPSRSKEDKSAKKQKRSRSPHRTRRKRSRSRSRKRSRSKSRSRSRSRYRSSSRRKRSRSRSRNQRSRRSHSLSRDRRRRGNYSQRDRWKREPSCSPELILRKKRSPPRKHGSNPDSTQRISDLGKEQLLEIAKANAAAMCAKVGMSIPASLRSSMLTFPGMAINAAMTAATMTAALSNINTLSALLPLPTITNKPPGANLSSNINSALEEVKKKLEKQANSISIKEFTDRCKMIVESKGELPVAMPHVSGDEDDGKPFGGSVLREHKAINFNISNTTVRPTARSDAGKAKEFPVSSGSQHRKKESKTLDAYGDWVPVDKTSDETKTAASSSSGTSETLKDAELPAAAEESAADDDCVFPGPPPQPVDISQAVSERIKAQKRLAENPYDVNAICMLSRAQEQVDAWAQSNTVPGLFTGSTGAQVLSSEELSNSGPQAWLKKDQFLRAAPVSGGVGEFLMKKMGWRTGEGLGRNREGTVEPIVIDFKVDRKGLLAEGEKTQKPTGGLVVTKDLMGKHPVSALIELCTKKRMAQPDFVMVHHSGPDHRKNFLFKVTVNGADYQPQTASPNKKHAKAMAATVALQALGEVPADGPGLYAGPVFTAASTGPLFST